MHDSYDDDPLMGTQFAFDDRTIRLGFIRKVYSILMVQLTVTVTIMSIFFYVNSVKVWTQQNPAVFWVAFAVTLVAIIVLACCQDIRRRSPHNFIFLGLFTLAEGFMLGTAASRFESEEVLIAVGICAIVCFALTCFAFQTRFDFTGAGSILFVLLIILMIFGIFAIFMPGNTERLIYACLGALIFSGYLVFDTQLMIGGKHKYSLSPEEYIFAALNLYLDIINLFLFILQIVSAGRD